MSWKKRHRSFYYKYAEDPDDIILKSSETAHLIIDVQKTYLEPKSNPEENLEWQPFFNRMSDLVIPNIKNLISFFSISVSRRSSEAKIKLLKNPV